jgi:hypothetical protein
VDHGIVDVFAFQEALLIEAVFAVTILVMVWAGFRRWLQHKERMGRLIADQTAERAAQYGAHIERVEERLRAVEQIVADGAVQPAGQIGAPGTDPLALPRSVPDEVRRDA